MKNLTTYYARRTNLFVWLTALLMAISAVARIIAFSGTGGYGFFGFILRIAFPIIANLFIAIRLPSRGEKMFYVTVGPVILCTLYLISTVIELFGSFSPLMCTVAAILFAAQCVLYVLTYTGKIGSQLPVLCAYLIPLAAAAFDSVLRYFVPSLWYYSKGALISFAALYLGIITAILSSRKMPPAKEGDPYRLRYGDRYDGRLVRNLTPMAKMSPYFMETRNTSSNYIRDCVEISNAERYIRQKRKEGLKHFGLTHIILAAYVRAVADYPSLNRFLSGQKVYHRYTIDANMVIKKDMSTEGEDTTIKVYFDPADTAKDVYEKYDAKLQAIRDPNIVNNFDKTAQMLDYIPGILKRITIRVLRILDYFGMMPQLIEKVSPFHGSMFITSMGSLGIPPIFHHLYDFGNVPVFCAFGPKRTEKTIGDNGEIVSKKYIDYTWVTDERIVDGYYYAQVLKRIRYLIMHPDLLDNPPEEVKEDVY